VFLHIMVMARMRSAAARRGRVGVRRVRRVVCVLLLLPLAVGPPGGPASAQAGLSAATATASVDADRPGRPIPASFLGLSHEWGTAQQLMGSPASGTNSIYRQLVGNLLAFGGGPLIIRVGGNSTDATGEPQPGTTSPFAQLASDLGAQFVLGVNLGAGDLQVATDQARAYLQGMPAGSLQAIEIGNEPDLFPTNGHRPPPYSPADYLHDFARWQAAIRPLLPAGVGLVGPSWAKDDSLAGLPTFLDQFGPSLAWVSHHWYAGTRCNGRLNPPDYLLHRRVARLAPRRSATRCARAMSVACRCASAN
jgi:hypothetical protein